MDSTRWWGYNSICIKLKLIHIMDKLLRAQIAASIMSGLAAASGQGGVPVVFHQQMAEQAVQMADALIAELNKEGKADDSEQN